MSATAVREDREGVTELRLERPESRNALNTQMLIELRDHLAAVQDDDAVRVVVLTGAGGAFSAGADIHEFAADAPAEGPLRRIRLVTDVLRRLAELEQPTIAAVHGPAVGAGWGLALACDLCFASREAVFRLPEVAKGLRIPQLLMRRLVQVVGPVRAAELTLAGTSYDADGALAAGCVTRVLGERAELVEEARRLAADLATRPRRSLATAKQPLRDLAPRVPFPPPELTWTEE